MKSVFSIASDSPHAVQDVPVNGYELTICFNGLPGTVILELTALGSNITPEGHEMARVALMRASLKSSHARAIASALLSAATESR